MVIPLFNQSILIFSEANQNKIKPIQKYPNINIDH